MDFTQKYHHKPYPGIDPTLPALSQRGRTVMITGGGRGIGFAISRAFVAAGASRLIILGRRQNVLDVAKSNLEKSGTEILLEQCDVGSAESVKTVWIGLAAREVAVDVLILNAALNNSILDPLGDGGPEKVWSMYEFNVLAQLRMVQFFMHQGPEKGKAVINVSSGTVHMNPCRPGRISYAATKSAFANLFQFLADGIEVEQAQMVSFHPGSIFTEAARASGYDENSLAWDNGGISYPATRFDGD